MSNAQPAILRTPPALARFLTLGLAPGARARDVAARLTEVDWGATSVIGIGAPLVLMLGASVPGLRPFRALACGAGAFPSTQGALWISLGGDDGAAILLRARALVAALGDAFTLDEDVAAFRYGAGRDLSGFEDGTENPKDERAVEVAIVAGAGAGLDGSSFVAAQRWVHDLARLERMSVRERELAIGRRLDTNEEIARAPASAHVKRSAQESFDPPAFMLRRSMPWGDVREHGLYFVAYGASLDAFERVLARMAGLEDGVVDALLGFSRAVSGGNYWCPPMRAGKLDLRALGL